MKGDVTLIFLIFMQAVVFAAAWFGPGMKDLADRADHDHGKQRLRKELSDELDRYLRDKDARREIERLRGLSDDLALKSLSDILDRMEKRGTGEADNIIRRLMKKLNLPDPPVYKLLDGRYSASDAERTCKGLGGQLAVIRHGIDQSLAWETSSKASYAKVFIGLMRRGGRIYWRDGSKFTFFISRNGFSMRYNDTNPRNCGIMDRADGTWSFALCSVKRAALCQFKRNSTPRAPPEKYMLLNGLFRAAAAVETCHAVGGRLAIIRNRNDQSLAYRIAKKSTTYNIFIGMVRDRRGLKWRDGSDATYQNFRKGYNPRYSGVGSCGVIRNESGVWQFMSCNSHYEALCEFSVDSTSRPPTHSGRFFETDLRFMFQYEASRKDRRFTADLITAIGELLQKDTRDISVLSMRPGSTIVHVRIYFNASEDAEMIEAALHREAKTGGFLDMKFYGRLRPIIDPFPGHSKATWKIVTPIVVLVIVLIAIAIIVVAFMVLMASNRISTDDESSMRLLSPKLKRHRNVRPAVAASEIAQVNSDPLPTYREFTANDYSKPPGGPNAPPAYHDAEKPPIA